MPPGIAQTQYFYISCYGTNKFYKYTNTGIYDNSWGGYGTDDGYFNLPAGIAVDSKGFVYVCDADNHRIQKFDSNGNYLAKWGSFGIGNNQFNRPEFIAISGNEIYITDKANNRVVKYSY